MAMSPGSVPPTPQAKRSFPWLEGKVAGHLAWGIPILSLALIVNYLLIATFAPSLFENVRPPGPGEETSAALASVSAQVSATLSKELRPFASQVLETRLEPMQAGRVRWTLERSSLELASPEDGEALTDRLQRLSFDPVWDVVIMPQVDEPYSAGVLVSVSGFPTHVLTFFPTLTEVTLEPGVMESVAPKAMMALLLDDVGYHPESLEPLLALTEAFSVAVIPQSPYAAVSAELAYRNGKEVLVHLPLEPLAKPLQGKRGGTAGQLRLEMPLSEITERTHQAIGRVPHAVGLNNHEGSAFMQDREHVRAVLEGVAAHSLFFVDSRTIGRTVGYELARSMGIPAAERQVFLDNEAEEASIKRALARCQAIAMKRGKALCIGHPYPETLRVLREYLSSPPQEGLERVPVSALLDR